MSELEPLDPLSHELLEAARGGHLAPTGSRERVRRRIVTRVGAAAFLGSTMAAAGMWIKIGALTLALLALGGGVAYWAFHRPPAPATPLGVSAIVAPAQPFPVASVAEIASVAEVVAPIDSVLPAPPVKTHTSPRVSASPPTISEETALLLGAEGAIREGDATRALSLLDEHARRFPSGMLSEEREATRVLALCAAGRATEARAASERFLAAHPRSPAAARVRTSCAGP